MSINVRYSDVCWCRKFRCLLMSDIQVSVDTGNSDGCYCLWQLRQSPVLWQKFGMYFSELFSLKVAEHLDDKAASGPVAEVWSLLVWAFLAQSSQASSCMTRQCPVLWQKFRVYLCELFSLKVAKHLYQCMTRQWPVLWQKFRVYLWAFLAQSSRTSVSVYDKAVTSPVTEV